MKKENIYVKVTTLQEAKNYRKILKQLDEPISDIYFENFDAETKSHCNLCFCPDGNWTMGAVEEGEKITFGQLIDLLNEPKKIAVKVENEKEFKALERYLNVEHNDSVTFPLYAYPDELHKYVGWDSDIEQLKDYQIIPFADFAKEHEIKLPQTVSQDNVELFIGDKYFLPQSKGLNAEQGYYPEPREFTVCVNTNNIGQGVFSTKEAALSWIEAQKPKEKPQSVVLHADQEYTDTVFSDHVEISGNFIGLINTDKVIWIMKKDLEEILHAMNNDVSENKNPATGYDKF